MNLITKYIFQSIAVVLLCAVSVSCSQDDLGLREEGTLPEGKFPLKLTASVEGMVTRADDDKGFWTDGDPIRVRIGNANGYYPWVGHYKLTPNGYVKEAVEALAWPYEEGYVGAWFPYFDNESTEVTITDQSKGYHFYDFMTARSGTVGYTAIVNLAFKHLMTKVNCNLSVGEGITTEDLETATVRYFGFSKAKFSENGVVGAGDNNGLITPTEDFTALLVPQDMSGQPFIEVKLTVKVNGVSIDKTLTYAPEQGNLKAGTAYTFNIKVQKDRLVVQTITGEWNDDNGSKNAGEVLHRVNFPQNHNQTLSFSSNVTPVYGDTRAGDDISYLLVRGKDFTISYDVTDANYMKGFVPTVEETGSLSMNCSQSGDGYTFQYTLKSQTVNLKYDDYAQVGDVYYSDGTWSRETINGKIPIGIVFRTDTLGTGDKPSNYTWKEGEDEYRWADDRPIRGYVVALEDASSTAVKWQNGSTTVLTDGNQNDDNSKYSGYVNATQIRKTSEYKTNKTPACEAADKYQPSAPIYNAEDSTNPYYSSGWYLPSIKQLWDLFLLYKLNVYLQKAGGTALLEGASIDYWSSTEHRSSPTQRYSSIAFAINFYQAKKKTDSKATKSMNKYVRSVLTF